MGVGRWWWEGVGWEGRVRRGDEGGEEREEEEEGEESRAAWC